MIRVRKETGGSSLSITKNWETLIEQTHRKVEENLELRKIKRKKQFVSIHQFKWKEIGW